MKRYVSQRGRARLLSLYDASLERVRAPLTAHTVETRAGPVRVWTGGRSTGSPVLVISGLGPVVQVLADHPFLLDAYQVQAVDLPGVPGGSGPDHADHDSAFLLDVLDGLGIPVVDIFCTSLAASAAHAVVTHAPERVGKVIFVMPIGFQPVTALRVFRQITIPTWTHAWFPEPARAEALAATLAGGVTPEQSWVDWVGARARFLQSDPRPWPLLAPLDSRHTVLLVVAEREVFYYPLPLLAAAKETFGPNVQMLPLDTGHLPDPESRARIAAATRMVLESS